MSKDAADVRSMAVLERDYAEWLAQLRDVQRSVAEWINELGDDLEALRSDPETSGDAPRIRALEALIARALRENPGLPGLKASCNHEHKSGMMKCPHCGEEFDPSEREPDADPDDKGCDPKDKPKSAGAHLIYS